MKNIIFSKTFLEKHRKSSKDFSRNRKLSFATMILFLMNLLKGSYQDELDGFFKATSNKGHYERIVSKSAFCKARHKVAYEAFIDLNSSMTSFFYQNFPHEKWNGLNLLAIDGSTARPPKNNECSEHFGNYNKKNEESRPIARISQMFDVLNKVTIDAIISPREIGERTLAAKHFLKLLPEDLLLLDRGYPASWLFKLILSQGANFCARVPYDNWKEIKAFFESGKFDQIKTISMSPHSKMQCLEIGLDIKPLKLRLIRVELDNGVKEVLITSLLDRDKYPLEIFSELYHMRWPVEEDYKVMKCRAQIENFSGKSVLSVYQDFHAKVLSKNFASILAHPTKPVIDHNCRKRKLSYQVNFTQALSKIKDTIVILFTSQKDSVMEIVCGLHQIFIQTIEPIRKGRKYPRNHKIRTREFYPSYKQIR